MAIYIRDENGQLNPLEIPTIKGEDGVTPNIQIGTVTTLEPGEEATVTITGTKENPVLNFAIPRGEKGADGKDGVGGGVGNNNIILDFEVGGMLEIQPTALDLETGIFTCDNVSFTGNTQIVPKYADLSKFPKAMILHNDLLKIVKLSDTTFKLQRRSSDITYDTSQQGIDVSDFKFSQGTSMTFNNLNMNEDGVYVIHLHGLRGRSGQTNFHLKDAQNNLILHQTSLVDGKPILFITAEITITKNKDFYSDGAFVRSMYNKISGTTLGFDYSTSTSARGFKKNDSKISILNINGAFTNGTRVWIEKVV